MEEWIKLGIVLFVLGLCRVLCVITLVRVVGVCGLFLYGWDLSEEGSSYLVFLVFFNDNFVGFNICYFYLYVKFMRNVICFDFYWVVSDYYIVGVE